MDNLYKNHTDEQLSVALESIEKMIENHQVRQKQHKKIKVYGINPAFLDRRIMIINEIHNRKKIEQ